MTTTRRQLELTDELQRRLTAVREALAIYDPGYESASVVELPKLALAEAVLDAVRAQKLATVPRARPVKARIDKLSKSSIRPNCLTNPKRRKRA